MSVGTPVSLGATADATDAAAYTHNTSGTVPSGALVVVAIYWVSDTTPQAPTVSGGGLTWTQDVINAFSDGAPQEMISLWSAPAPSGLASGTTITVTPSNAGATTFNAVVGAAYIPGALGAESTQTSTTLTPASGAWASGNLTPVSPDAVVMTAAFYDSTDTETSTPTAPTVELFDVGTSEQTALTLTYRPMAPDTLPGTVTNAGTWSGNPSPGAVGTCSVVYRGDDAPATFVGVGATSNGAASVVDPTNLAPTLPSGLANGDLLLLITEGRSITATCATPTGWTLHPDFPKTSGTASGGRFYVFYRWRDGSESTPTVTWSGLTTGTSGDSTKATIIAYRNIDPNFADGSTGVTDAAAAGTLTLPSATSTFTDGLFVACSTKISDTVHTWTPSTGWSERSDTHTGSGIGHSQHIQDKLQPAAGSSGTPTIACSLTSSLRCLAVVIPLASRRPRPRAEFSRNALQQAASI